MEDKAAASNLKAMETLVNIVDQMVSNRIRTAETAAAGTSGGGRDQKRTAFLLAHPVGTIYTSTGNNPQSIYGGTWIQMDMSPETVRMPDGEVRNLRVKRWLRIA